jgi:hypothetical protein
MMTHQDAIASFHRILALKDRAVCASIDAANCRTPYDWKKSHEADDTLAEAVDGFEALLAALGEDPPLLGRDDLVSYSSAEAATIVKAIEAIREDQPARAIAQLSKITEAREQLATQREQQRRAWEANAIAQAESKQR